MRQILRLLHEGNKYDLFLFLSLLKLPPTKSVSLVKRKEMACTKCFGMGTVFSYSCKNTHHSARHLPWQGDGHQRGQPVGSLQPCGPSKRQTRSNRCLPASKPSSLKAISRLITSFFLVFLSLIFVCWWSVSDCKRTDRGVSGKYKLSGCFCRHADEQTEWDKAKAKTTIQSLAWLVFGYN